MNPDSRPISIRSKSFRLRHYPPEISHAWERYSGGWLTTLCMEPGDAVAPDEYELLASGAPLTCITCLVRLK